jgi:hypothetical protein
VRTILAVLYCAIFSVASLHLLWLHKPSEPKIVAVHELPAGHLLQAGDLTVLDNRGEIAFLGRFTTLPIPSLMPVTEQNTSPFPALAPTEGRTRLILPVRRTLLESGTTEERQTIRVCQGAATVVGEGTVVLAGCADSGGNCTAVIDVTTAQAAALLAASGKAPEPTFEHTTKPCGS